MRRSLKTVSALAGTWFGLIAGSSFGNPLPIPLTFSRPVIIDAPDGTPTVGRDINNAGMVVGHLFGADRAFAWTSQAGFIDLNPPGMFSFAFGVNDCGEIAGAVGGPSLLFHAARWKNAEEFEDLGTLGGHFSFAFDVNENGAVVGYATVPNGDVNENHAFLWTEANGMRDLGTLGGDESVAEAVNNHNEVVGFSDGRPFFWSQSTGMTDLTPKGFNSGFALDINDAGEVVGNLSGSGPGAKGFKWTRKGGTVLLGDFGNHSATPRGLNESGHIVGTAIEDSGRIRATLWLASKRAIDIDPGTGIQSDGAEINDRGQILATAAFNEPANQRAVVWQIKNFKPRGRDIAAAARLCQLRQ